MGNNDDVEMNEFKGEETGKNKNTRKEKGL